MIFEVKRFRAKLLGEQGKRIINILLETCATKGVVSAEFEEAAAGQVGLVRLLPEDAEPSLKESFLRYYFAKGMSVEDVMAKLLKTGDWRTRADGVEVFVVSKVSELQKDCFAG